MAAQSNSDVVNLFKEVYGDLVDLLPQDEILAKDIPFSAKQKVGEKFVEAVVLTHETGITLAGSSADSVELNPAIAGVVKQAEVSAYTSILPSVLPWGMISRSAGAGAKAFYEATKYLIRNNLQSHQHFQEILRLYGQADALLGYVSYYTGTYRGASFTTGTGTLTLNGSSVTLTTGVNTTSKWILLAPGSFASGIWVGMEGVKVNQVNSSAVIVASGKLVAVDSDQGAIQVDFTPVAATSTTSHRICFDGQESTKDYVGINKILSTTGTLFQIATSSYSLWKSTQVNLASTKLTFPKLQTGVAAMVNRSGLKGKLNVYVNSRTWANLSSTESGARIYDESYVSKRAEQGFESIMFHTQSGPMEVISHRCVKEGEAYALFLPAWSRSGSSEVSFSIPGMGQDIIFPLPNQTAYAYRSFSDQYIFCHEPAKNVYFYGINDEAAS